MNNFHMREGKVEFRWKRWRNKKRQEVSSCLMVLFSGMVLLGAGGVALAGPTGGQVTGGTGTINQTGTTTNVDQTSNVLNINWQDFSIGANETVNFNQPGADALAINRVVGGVPSFLAGALNANGRVFILNSAGITFTGTSHVNVGALLATTAMTVNGDPTKSASYSGTGYGSVINQGTIEISNGGFAILAAPYVQNTGFVKADLGTIALAGTNQFTLDLSGTGLINFVVPAGTVEQIVNDGKALGVDNSGTLQARSGQVIISANVASQVVNAVVNLNGVVDADAFAPNGTGGSVLVTGAGDINVGGQVTARGSGAGAGGQIVTKAGGADDIEALAFVSAAGGAAGGKGGFIEVSGRTIGLHGNIDPGAGGSIYVDPFNIDIVAANLFLGTLAGSTVTGTQIGTDFIENQLKAGHNVNMDASGTAGGGGNVTFEVMNDDHRLAGGAGNLTVTANRNIIVKGTNDAIVQGGGDILLTANNGNIGSAGHALSLITGVGIPDVGDAAFVTQAGDIVLKAPNGNITVHNVTVKSSGASTFHALFSANAGHNFTATGDISVEAVAHGPIDETASATVNIKAGNNITVHNVTVDADATQNGSGFNDAHALANLQLAASGNIHANGDLIVDAFAQDAGDGDAHANALGNIQANGDANIGGNVHVSATAKQSDSDGSSALACANLELQGYGPGGSVNVNGDVTVDALAQAAGSGVASANALGTVYAANHINISGNVDVSATANQLGSSSGAALACANMRLGASASVNVNGNIGVHAFAQDSGRGVASANAQGSVYASNVINISGSVDVTANAKQLGTGSGDALACANLVLQAQGNDVNVNGNIAVDAIALSSGGTGADASANAQASIFAANDVVVNNVEVSANAKQLGSFGSSARACANLLLFASTSINVKGDISVDVFAQDSGRGNASANAEGNLFAVKDIDVVGNIYVGATANDAGNSGSHARACANLRIAVATYSTGNVNVNGDVTASANAVSHGSESAIANANVHILANQGDVTVNGVVTANAHAVASSTSFCNGARAQASIDVHGDPVTLGGVVAHATATSNGTGRANALANVGVTGSSNVAILGSVTVEATAVAPGSSGEGSGVQANANFHARASNQLSISGAIDVSALANDHDLGPRANALACASMTAGNSSSSALLLGDITVQANALDQNGGGQTEANAQLLVQASNGGLKIDSVHVMATANEQAGSVNAHANALANAFLNADDTASADGRCVLVTASAFDGSSARANATLQVNGSHVVLGTGTSDNVADGSFGAKAKAVANGNPGRAQAVANVVITATSGNASIFDNLVAIASASYLNNGGNTIGNVLATADLVVTASSANIVLEELNVKANAQNFGDNSARAQANASLVAASVVNVFESDALFVSATADNHNTHANASVASGTAALANARLHINGTDIDATNASITVRAHALNAGHAGVKGIAKLDFGSATSVDVDGITIDVLAHNLTSKGGKPGAIASASLTQTNSSAHWTIGDGGINVQADASSQGNYKANAKALVDIEQNSIDIDGPVTVNAQAVHGALVNSGTGALASAKLILDGSSSGVDVSGAIDVKANAHNGGANSHANALACASITAGSGSVSLDNIAVTAEALDVNGKGATKANAQLLVSASTGAVHIGSVDVTASANEQAGSANAHARAIANASIFAANTANAIGRNVLVTANAFDGSSAFASATLNVTGSHVALGSNIAESLESAGTDGSIGAKAKAIANGNPARAQAIANVLITANSGNASIFDNLVGIATASHNGANTIGNVLATASVHVLASGTGSANITLEGLHVSANAQNFGDNSARAQANANIEAGTTGSGHVCFTDSDSVFVSATADNHNSLANAAVVSGNAAFANAQLEIDGNHINATSVTIDVRAHALNNGFAGVAAVASLDMGEAASVNVNGIIIDALANNLTTHGGKPGAKATASLIQSNTSAHWTIGAGGINIQAAASSHGHAKAKAKALVDIDQNSISIAGPVTVNALAFAGNLANTGAVASAFLELDASVGQVFVGGDVNVKANAHNGGANSHASALACASFLSSNSGSTAISMENITVEADAFDRNGKGLTKANAQLLVSASSGGLDVGSVHVTASANEQAGTANAHAQAIANASLNADDTASADGQFILVVANAFDGSSAKATASLNVSGSHVLLGNSTLDTPDASIGAKSKAVANGNPGRAQAFTNVKITATSGNVTIFDNLVGIASASYLTNGGNTIANVVATADVEVSASSGSIFMEGMRVKANAQNFGDNSARAQANADIHANSTTGVVKFNDSDSVFVSATADNHNGLANASVVSGNAAFANAQLDIDANQINATSVAIDVKAHALNNGFAGVAAIANLDMGEAASVNVFGLTVDVQALNLTTHGGKPGAIASATFNEAAGQHLTVGAGGVNVQADASSQGHAKASAHALVNIAQNFISIDGPVTVNAQAVGGALVNSGVVAVASLFLSASTGNVSVDGPVFVKANAQNLGDGVAHGNAVADIDASGNISINGDVDVAATANQLDSDGNNAIACASLELDASTGGSVNVNGGIGVYAKAQASGATFASANAQASIANASNITINGNVDVTASANVTNPLGTEALACANLRMDIIGESSLASINVNGHINVDAFAQSEGHDDVTANAKAEVEAEGSSGEFGGNVTVNGNIDVTATANHAGSGTGRASACANLDLDGSSGNVNVNGSIGVYANAQSLGDGFARAQANAEIGAENDNLNGSNAGHVWVNGSIEVKATANQLDSDGGNAFACANLDVDASSGSINVNGSITVEGLAQVSGSGAKATANADAELEASTAVTVNGLVSANAQALSLNSHGSGASARATVDIDALASGNITLGGVADKAFASSQGVNGANALAGVDIGTAFDEGNSSSGFVNHINIANNVIVNATAVGGSDVVHNVVAIADLQIDEARSINIGGTLGIHANAQDNGTTLSGAGLAHATGVLEALDSITINGQVSVTADLRSAARGSGTVPNVTVADELVDDGLELNLAIAKLHIGSVNDSPGTGVNIKLAGVAVTANLDLTNSSFGGKGQAIAGLVIEADNVGSVLINGNLLVMANGQAKGNSGSLEVSATADISAHSGVTINGSATVKATASALGTATGFNASASAELTLETPSGNIAVGFVDVEAQAAYSGSKSGDANALAEAGITAGGGHAFLKGAKVFADADIPNSAGGSANGTAVANLTINASSNINVGTAGIFVQADAFAPSGGHAFANALSRLDAGTGGVGGIFIQGNDIGIAGAVGGSGSNTAHANVHLAAGGASEFGTGAPSNFGNVVVFGNIGAFAAADSLHDHATASVEIFAHNNIFIIGNDPIASARLGPNGSLVAFRQAHFSTNQSVTGTQGTATADIDIRAGGVVVVIPSSSLTHIDKLFALPVDKPTLDSNGLTIIPLSIDGQDCGVLGQAGATEEQLNKGKSCPRTPINVSGLTDVSP